MQLFILLFPVAYILHHHAAAQIDLSFRNVSWCKVHWSHLKMTKETKELLVQCKAIPNVQLSDDVDEIIRRSNKFPIKFPIESVRLKRLKQTVAIDKLKKNIVSTYPIVHERVLKLMAHFLLYKREYGSSVEKALYKNMLVADLIDRILKKRAVSFITSQDSYLLLNGASGIGGWEDVGTEAEISPLKLENCLSYDEMKLASMVFVSGHTECINNGNRGNKGVVSHLDVEPDAVIIGIIAPRFERQHRMEYEDIVITEEQNTALNGYGDSRNARRKWRDIWAEFYQIGFPTYTSLRSLLNNAANQSAVYSLQDRYVNLPRGGLFDNEAYCKRTCVIAESVLLEAETRAKMKGKYAFINVIGAGLGEWKISDHQVDVFMTSFLERIHVVLGKGLLNHVSDVNFAYIRPSEIILDMFTEKSGTQYEQTTVQKLFLESKTHPRGGINVQLENREPSSKLTGEHEGKLLVMTYPWDGNAHPGNEFWWGSLDGSGDPAAASSTQVAELHNAHINPSVTGHNTKIVGHAIKPNGFTPITKYCTA